MEADYQVNGIHYSLQNTSALMGRHHGLTTKFNRRFDRHFGTPSEYAGYVVSVDIDRRRLSLMAMAQQVGFDGLLFDGLKIFL